MVIIFGSKNVQPIRTAREREELSIAKDVVVKAVMQDDAGTERMT